MTAEWRIGRLGDCVLLQSGGTPSKSRADFWTGDIPWVSAKDMKSYWIEDTEDHLSKTGASVATRVVEANTTLLLVRGMTLHRDVPISRIRRSAAFNQDVKAVLARSKTDPEFVPYLLLGNKAKLLSIVDSAGHGTGRLNSDTLLNLPVRIPPANEQRAIAHILGTLDDKIELNRRMNETLEEMARTLFKSWFVDFDPVRAKAEGRDPGLPKRIADLFPDRFEDSELGAIPAGWETDNLGNLLELAYGKALKQNTRKPGDVAVFGSNGQIGWHNERLVEGPGIIVGRKGNPGLVEWSATDFFPIDTAFYVKAKDARSNLPFLFYALRAHDLPSLAADSAVPGLNRNFVYQSQQTVPTASILSQFDSIVEPLFERVHRAHIESRILAAIRNALLPRLISGEYRVEVSSILDGAG